MDEQTLKEMAAIAGLTLLGVAIVFGKGCDILLVGSALTGIAAIGGVIVGSRGAQ